jgi:hypothetical protein
MIVMPMNPKQRRQLDRVPRREWVVQTLEIALPIVIGAGIFIALVWLRSRGGPTWMGLTLAAAALAKPALVVIRVLEKRRFRSPLD